MNQGNNNTSNDFFSVWKGYIDNTYSYFEKSIPQYHQSISNLYQEYIEVWKNIACSGIDIQNGFAKRMGLKSNMAETTIKIVNDIEHESKTAIDVQNKITIASINSAKQSLNTLNAKASEFTSLNKNIIEGWPSMITTR